MQVTPIPRDIPLPLPAPAGFLELLLIVAFITHILFVNLLVGGSILVFGLQVGGLRNPDLDRLARQLAMTVTVNKSLAVVLGVAPLLLINVLYTMHFYTANALTGTAWIMLVPAIAASFLLLYAHQYSWDRLAEVRRAHIAIGALATVMFLAIPLVFLANVNLRMFPERWTSIRWFLSALTLANVFPRYLHFLSASLILTSLFGVAWLGRQKSIDEAGYTSLDARGVRRIFYSVAFAVSVAQYLVGPLVLFTLPSAGLAPAVLLTILTGAIASVPAVWLLWRELTAPADGNARLALVVGYLAATVVLMATGRHIYRGYALAEHRARMRDATERWTDAAAQAGYDRTLGKARAAAGVSEGQATFEVSCAACHGIDKKIVGPPLTEIASLYGGNPAGIVTWAKAPGKKRGDAPQMPSQAALGEAKLLEVAKFMLERGSRGR
jgi:cytochrome c